MRPDTVVRILAAALGSALLAACAGGGAPQAIPRTAQAPASARPFAQSCPAPGSMQRTGKGSGTVRVETAWAGGVSKTFAWVLTFNGLTPSEAQAIPRFVVRLRACGASNVPIGSMPSSGAKLTSECNNGTCTAKYEFTAQYVPPSKPKRALWKFDEIRFAPESPTPGYRYVTGILVRVQRGAP